jgi:hypothetical protein
MMIGRSRETTEQLDALLDGRLTEVPDELASLVAVADELRAELATIELDPAVAEQHLNRLYRRGRSGTRAARHQRVDRMWRRRVVSVGFAAILLLVPASFASGHALPGDPLYPLKRSIERVRLAAAMSPDASAQEKAHLADIRLEELQGPSRRASSARSRRRSSPSSRPSSRPSRRCSTRGPGVPTRPRSPRWRAAWPGWSGARPRPSSGR